MRKVEFRLNAANRFLSFYVGRKLKEARNNPYRLSWLIGVMSNKAWRAVYGYSIDKRHNNVTRAPITSPSGSGKKHPELCCRIGVVVE